MIETFCKRCRKRYFINTRRDKCPWCEEEDRVVNLVVVVVTLLVAIIAGCLWWMG